MKRGVVGGLLAALALMLLAGASNAGQPTRPAASGIPAGWTQHGTGSLTFALPAQFVADGSGLAAAARQWVLPMKSHASPAPAAAVFVDSGEVPSLAVRARLVGQARTAELGVAASRPAHAVRVPGADGAIAIEWLWDVEAVPSRQVEIVVATRGGQQYGLSLGGPSSWLTDEVLATFVASIAVAGGS